jgi:ABC-2 type transport system ATP-binding protein
MKSWALETQNLVKVFQPARNPLRLFRKPRSVTAVDGVNLRVRRGELFGLLGPNGAGKTTLIKLLCTLIMPTAGSARVLDYDLSEEAAIKQAVGLIVSDERSFYWRLSVRRNLAFYAALMGLGGSAAERRVDEVLAAVGLTEHAERGFRRLSTGMRQRLAIARGLIHRPQLLLMDEPTRSLDPIATARLHLLIRELVDREGMTILLTTHNLAEAESLCDRLALMQDGRIRACGSPDQLRKELGSQDSYRLRLDRWSDAVGLQLEEIVSDLTVERVDDGRVYLQFRVHKDSEALTAVVDLLRANKLSLLSIQSEQPTLDKVFAHFAGPEGEA